jgi:macrodomain Ter protein organizer (MatP/YcbG family)
MTGEYSIDPYILSILFNEQDAEKVLEIYRNIVDKAGKVFDITVKNYLLVNSLSEEAADKVLKAENTETLPENIIQLMQSPQLALKVKTNIKSLYKAYYDHLFPKLSPAKQQELLDYIKENEEMLAEQSQLFNKGISVLTQIFGDSGVNNYAKLVKKENYDTFVDSYLANNTGKQNDKKAKFDKLVSDYLKSL